MHNKGRFPNVIFGASLRSRSAALVIILTLLFLIFITRTAPPAQAQTCGELPAKVVIDWAQFRFVTCHTAFNPDRKSVV